VAEFVMDSSVPAATLLFAVTVQLLPAVVVVEQVDGVVARAAPPVQVVLVLEAVTELIVQFSFALT
jgi:hypothetical protein